MESKKPIISAIVAIGDGAIHKRVIGRKNKLLWPIPDDLKRFKELTMGHPVIMGRKTFESILSSLKKPLPGRTNIVVTRDVKWNHEGVVAANSIEDAIKKASELDTEEIFVMGGAQIYEQSLPLLNRLYVTLIDADEEGDAYFPPYEHLFTKMILHEDREANGLKYKWVDLER